MHCSSVACSCKVCGRTHLYLYLCQAIPRLVFVYSLPKGVFAQILWERDDTEATVRRDPYRLYVSSCATEFCLGRLKQMSVMACHSTKPLSTCRFGPFVRCTQNAILCKGTNAGAICSRLQICTLHSFIARLRPAAAFLLGTTQSPRRDTVKGKEYMLLSRTVCCGCAGNIKSCYHCRLFRHLARVLSMDLQPSRVCLQDSKKCRGNRAGSPRAQSA